MTYALSLLLGRLPIGWLQLVHNRSRFVATLAGVAFANVLVFVQLGIMGAMNTSIVSTYQLFNADILISAADANTLTEGENVPRRLLFRALSVMGVGEAAPLYLANAEWTQPDGSRVNFQIIGLPPEAGKMVAIDSNADIQGLSRVNTALIDLQTRGLSEAQVKSLQDKQPFEFEVNNQTLTSIGAIAVGGGFSADGNLLVSDQTFLTLFPRRSSGAPNHILVSVPDEHRQKEVLEQIRETMADSDIRIRSLDTAALDDQTYQTTKRPTGLIFGFGVVIGAIVGIVIVFQVLSTDVVDHLKEYATFKALGFRRSFFLSIVYEQATMLAIIGFIPGVLISLGIYAGLGAMTGLTINMTFERAFAVLIGTLFACMVSGAIATRRLNAADPADLF